MIKGSWDMIWEELNSRGNTKEELPLHPRGVRDRLKFLGNCGFDAKPQKWEEQREATAKKWLGFFSWFDKEL